MKHKQSLNKEYQLVFLLSDLGFPVSNNLFGQLTIVMDLCRLINKSLNNVDIYILTSGKHTRINLGKNIHVLNITDPLVDSLAYKYALEKILKNKKTTIVTSMMIHRDCIAVYEAAKLKATYSNLRILIGLYCTANEYFYKVLPISNAVSQSAKEYIEAKNTYTLTMQRYLGLMFKEDLVDKYLVPNEYTQQTYLDQNLERVILSKKIYILGSGADENLFNPVTPNQKKRIKKKYFINSKEFILCFGTRFTQYKGADIFEEILNYYNHKLTSPTFLFPFYPNGDTIFLLEKLSKYKRLLKYNKIKFCLDLYRQKFLLNKKWSNVYQESRLTLDIFINNLKSSSKEYVEKNFLGVLDFPIYHLADLLLRPSIADSQAITLFESSLCNCPTIGTDRVGFYHDVKELESYGVKLPESIQVFNKYADYKTPQYNKDIKSIARKFIVLIEKEMECFKQEVTPINSRQLIIKNGFTSKDMVKRHLDLYKTL